MPNNKSAIKRMRQSKERHLRNRSRKAALATWEKKFRAKLAEGDLETAAEYLRECSSQYDKAAKTNVVHANKADRKKAQLAKALSAAQQA